MKTLIEDTLDLPCPGMVKEAHPVTSIASLRRWSDLGDAWQLTWDLPSLVSIADPSPSADAFTSNSYTPKVYKGTPQSSTAINTKLDR